MQTRVVPRLPVRWTIAEVLPGYLLQRLDRGPAQPKVPAHDLDEYRGRCVGALLPEELHRPPAQFLIALRRLDRHASQRLESLEAALGSRQYARLRVGVGAAAESAALREHVLEEFAPEELPVLEATVRLAADAVECWVAQGTLAAMNQFNRRVRKEVSGW